MGWEKLLAELVPATLATTPRGRGVSKPGTGARVEPRLEAPASIPARPACTAMFLTWVKLIHTGADVATDLVSGVRGHAVEIAGNKGTYFLYISRLRGVSAQPRFKRVFYFSRLLLGREEPVSSGVDRRVGRILLKEPCDSRGVFWHFQ
jgi:hypothetical protein